MSKQRILAELDNIGIEINPLDEFLKIEEKRALPVSESDNVPGNKNRDIKMGRPRTRNNFKHCSLDLPREIYDNLRAMSFQRDIPMNSIIISALKYYLK